MIWRSALNVLSALIRNAFQRGHQCIHLDKHRTLGWGWDCSCGSSGALHRSEVEAIKSFHDHTQVKV